MEIAMNEKAATLLASISLVGALALGTASAVAVPLERQSISAGSYFRAKVPYVDQRLIAFTRFDIQALRALERMP
jgi:hypothetical protein